MTISEVHDEYLSAMVSMELAVKFALLDGRPVNGTLRACCKAVAARLQAESNRQIILGIARQALPDGALKMLRRQYQEMVVNKRQGVAR
ncbi:TPA: hypothetical protein SMF87_004530 [Serratia marcescens]|nr:hypothetical protein [Serratia marcescens]